MNVSVTIIGARGRVGSAVSARLRERGVELRDDGGELVLLCVPDRAIAEVANEVAIGPWIAHVSGGTPLATLEPHARRFSVHPLQTFTRDRGPEQLDGAWAAVSARPTKHARGERARRDTRAAAVRARRRPARALPRGRGDRLELPRHAAPHRRTLLDAADAPTEALDPLMRRVIDNGFQLTGPIERGDWETVERHRAAIASTAPELLDAYDALAHLTARDAVSQGSTA